MVDLLIPVNSDNSVAFIFLKSKAIRNLSAKSLINFILIPPFKVIIA
ncbi:hypothetical protein HMPREF1500_1036 [Fusobacterium sp. CM22]|nr:hypothetical protein HMPREF1500_1036 [Fusobacterium sp. CM22]